MHYRNLGRSGVKVSPLAVGTMTFGGPTDEATAARIVAKAKDQGVNFIDSADAYQGGKSQEIVGAAFNQRNDWVVATKLANSMGEGPNRGGLSRKWVMQAAEDSLAPAGLPTTSTSITFIAMTSKTPVTETVAAIGYVSEQARFATSVFPIIAVGASRKSYGECQAQVCPPARGLPALLQHLQSDARGRGVAGVRTITGWASFRTAPWRAACSPANIAPAARRRPIRAPHATTGA